MGSIAAIETRLRRRMLLFVIGIAALAAWWPRLAGPIDLRWDGGAYYLIGTSLFLGDGYRILSEPGTLLSSLHPPFLPALVAVHEFVLQSTDPVVVGHALRVTVAICSSAYAMAVFILLSSRLQPALAAVVALLCVLQPQYVYFSDSLYAETFFGLFTVIFFIVREQRQDRFGFIVCGLCAALAYESRTAGITLLAAWVIDHALRREIRRGLIALAISVLLVTSWMAWIKWVEAAPGYRFPAYAYQTESWLYFNVSYARNLSTYLNPFRPELGPLTSAAFVDRIIGNAVLLPKTIGQAVSSWSAPTYLALPLGMLVLGGLALQLARRKFAIVFYVVLSLAAICTTPFQKQFIRYLMPLFPFLALSLFEMLNWANAQARRRWPALPRALGVAVPWLIVAVIGFRASRDLRDMYATQYHDVAYEQHGRSIRYRLFYYGPDGKDYDAALDWLDRCAAPDATFVAADPQWAYLRTGRKSVVPPFVIDGRTGQRLVDSVPAAYLLAPVGQGSYRPFTDALIAANPDAWRRVWRGANGTLDVYQRTNIQASSKAGHDTCVVARRIHAV